MNSLEKNLFQPEHRVGGWGDRTAFKDAPGAATLLSIACESLRDNGALYMNSYRSGDDIYAYLGVEYPPTKLWGLFNRSRREIPLAAIEHGSGRLELRVYDINHEREAIRIAEQGSARLGRAVTLKPSYI